MEPVAGPERVAWGWEDGGMVGWGDGVWGMGGWGDGGMGGWGDGGWGMGDGGWGWGDGGMGGWGDGGWGDGGMGDEGWGMGGWGAGGMGDGGLGDGGWGMGEGANISNCATASLQTRRFRSLTALPSSRATGSWCWKTAEWEREKED